MRILHGFWAMIFFYPTSDYHQARKCLHSINRTLPWISSPRPQTYLIRLSKIRMTAIFSHLIAPASTTRIIVIYSWLLTPGSTTNRLKWPIVRHRKPILSSANHESGDVMLLTSAPIGGLDLSNPRVYPPTQLVVNLIGKIWAFSHWHRCSRRPSWRGDRMGFVTQLRLGVYPGGYATNPSRCLWSQRAPQWFPRTPAGLCLHRILWIQAYWVSLSLEQSVVRFNNWLHFVCIVSGTSSLCPTSDQVFYCCLNFLADNILDEFLDLRNLPEGANIPASFELTGQGILCVSLLKLFGNWAVAEYSTKTEELIYPEKCAWYTKRSVSLTGIN